jgi:TolB-like protein
MAFFDELKRRNVIRVGLAYAVVAWVIAQVGEFAAETFGAPDWVIKVFVVFLLLGLPLALFFAWVFEVTPEGIKLEKDVDRSASITKQTGHKLNRLIIAVLVLAVGILLVDKFYQQSSTDADELIATAGRHPIAVLPFVNMSDDSDHFADGLSEELLNLLAMNPELKVAGRTSAFAFKGRNEDLREIGDALGVEYVLEGSVRRSGERLRITAQLIKVGDGFHVWSDTYDRQMADIFDIQDDVAGAITDALRLRLSPKSDRSTDNPEAYALYLQAIALQTANERDAPDRAQRLLDQAIALDPGFAHAYELKAGYYWYQSGWLMDSPTAQALAYAAAMKALELDPTLAGARSFADTANPDWNWIDEFKALEKLVRLEPTNIRALDSLTYDMVLAGYFSEAFDVAERMIELEPLSHLGYMRKSEALFAAGRDEDARATAMRVFTEFDPVNAKWQLGIDALLNGDDESAVAWLEKLWIAIGQDPAEVRPLVTGARDPESGKAYIDDWIRSAVANAANLDERRIALSWYLPFGYLDEFWRAIDMLSDGIDKGWTNADLLEYGGMVWRRSGFARHPKYMPRSRAQGLTELWDIRGPPDHCSKLSGDWVCE